VAPRAVGTLAPMRTRLITGTVLLCAVVGLAVPACSSDNTVEAGSQKTSGSRPSTTEGSSSKDSGSSEGSKGSGGSNSTLPDLGSIAGGMGDCLEVAGSYAGLALGVLDGADGAKKSQKQAEQLKAKLPADLSDDIDVVAATFGRIAKAGVLDGASELNDPAFTKANDNITNYLQSECGGG